MSTYLFNVERGYNFESLELIDIQQKKKIERLTIIANSCITNTYKYIYIYISLKQKIDMSNSDLFTQKNHLVYEEQNIFHYLPDI